jgi:hypothetical protein
MDVKEWAMLDVEDEGAISSGEGCAGSRRVIR